MENGKHTVSPSLEWKVVELFNGKINACVGAYTNYDQARTLADQLNDHVKTLKTTGDSLRYSVLVASKKKKEVANV